METVTPGPSKTWTATWPISAAVSAVVWLCWALFVRPDWTAVLLLLSPFVLVALGLRVAAQAGPQSRLVVVMAQVAPLIALAPAASYALDPGLLAAALTVPWLLFTIVVALAGVARLLTRTSLQDGAWAIDFGLIYIVVGGTWLTITRAGLRPLHFHEPIIELTAVHFHYAGFALPIVAGLVAHRSNYGANIAAAVVLGVPFTALGITVGGTLEWIAATFMALAGLGVAALLVDTARRANGLARLLTIAAGLSLAGGMSLAIGWAWAVRFGWNYLGLQEMAGMHGSLNALGFGFLGLLGLNLMASSDATTNLTARVALYVGRPTVEHLEALASRAEIQSPTNMPGLLHRDLPVGFKRKVWTRQIAHGDFDRAADAIRSWAGHDCAGIVRWPAQPPIMAGQTLAMAIPVGPLAITATSRIIDVVDEPERYGFTYTTMPHHPVDGEESFIVERGPTGAVTVTVIAVWQQAMLATRVCPPVTTFLQDRAIGQYLDGIANSKSPVRT